MHRDAAQRRACTPNDVTAIKRLAAGAYAGDSTLSDEYRLAPRLLKTLPEGFEPQVVEERGEIVAYGAVAVEPWMVPARRRRLRRLWGRGDQGPPAMRVLVDHFLSELVARGVETVEARLPAGSEDAARVLDEAGFAPIRQDVLQELSLDGPAEVPGAADAASSLPPSLRLTDLEPELAGDPGAMARLHELWIALAREDPAHDPAGDPPLDAFDTWMRGASALHAGCPLAVEGDAFVGLSLTRRKPDEPGTLVQNLTGVLPPYRRRGIATALKLAAIAFGRSAGFERIQTWVAGENQGMRALNARLGYQERLVLTVYEKLLLPPSVPQHHA